MKIIYFAHSLLSRGGDKMVLAHTGWLASHGHDVELCCNIVDTVLDIPKGVRVSRPYFPGTLGTVVSALMQRRDADIILASIIPMACFLYPRSRRKVVYFAQGFDDSYCSSQFLKGLTSFFYYVGLKLFHIQTIAVSYPLANYLSGRFHARVAVVENGVDTKVFYPDADPELVAVKGNRRAVLLLSRSDWCKGFDIAQDVIGLMSKSHPDLFEVWTVGEPCAGLFPNIVHREFGYVVEDKLRKIMSSADVFLYPSRHEGLPLMPMEAFACRCLVVTTDAVAYVSQLKNALVAPVGDIERITELTVQALSGFAAIEQLVDCGFQTAEKMSLKSALAHFASVVERMVNGVKH